jgi:hypothetical protein
MRSTQAFSVFFVAAWLAGPLRAQTGEEPAFRAGLDYATQYVFRGVQRAGASVQPSVELAKGDLRGGLGSNLPFQGGAEREADLNLAYSWRVTEELALKFSAVQYWHGDAPVDGTRRSFETGLTAVATPVKGIIPSLDYYHDFRLRADTVQVSLTRGFPLTSLGTYLDLNLFAGWVAGGDWRPDAPGPPRHDSYRYWGAEAHLPYRIGLHTTVIAGLHFSDSVGRSPTNGPDGLAGGRRFWATLGVSLDF